MLEKLDKPLEMVLHHGLEFRSVQSMAARRLKGASKSCETGADCDVAPHKPTSMVTLSPSRFLAYVGAYGRRAGLPWTGRPARRFNT